MATKKREKTIDELLRERQLEQIENFSIDDGEEEHSIDQIIEAASQQGIFDLYNPFEERAKKIAEEEEQAPKRPTETQSARQTVDQLGNLGNMVKKTEFETLPKITNEAVRNYNLSKVGRDYLSKYDDSTSYADIQKDIAEVQSKKGEDEYDLALAMLKNYVNQKYDLNGTDLSQDAIKRRQEVYDYNQNEIDRLNQRVGANEGDTENLNLDDEETVSKYLNHDKNAVDFFMGYRSGRIAQDAANQEKYITMRDYIENAANSDSVRDLRNEVENLRAQNATYDRTQGQSDRYALQYGDDVKNEKSDLLAGTLHTRNNVPENFDDRVENGNDRFTDMGDISHPAIKRYGGENAVEDYNNMDAHTEMLTSEEKGIYSYLLRNEGEVSANAYLDSLKDVLQKRASETTQEYIDNASGAEKAVLLAASVPMNVYGTVTGFAEDAANIVAGKDIHPYSEAHSMYNIAQQTRSSVAEDIDEATNSWNVLGFSAGDAFQAAMSIPDFMLGSLTPSYYAASMSMGAAQSTAKELWEEGATNEQIVAESVLSGAAEYVFEKVSLDKIIDTADKSKLVKSALAGMAIEGSEEANTEIANIISDVLVRGSQSEWHKAIQNYKDQGYSDSESQAKAFSDMAKRVGYSAIGGAIGGAGGGAGVAIEKGAGLIQNKSERNKYIASVGADVTEAGNTQALLDTADQMKDNATVQAQAQKVRQAQTKNAEKGTESSAKVLSRETGKLYSAIQDSNAQGIQNAEADEIKAAIKQAYAAETGEDVKSDTVKKAAEAIYKSEYTGEKLTRAERNLASTSQAQLAVESVRNNLDLIEQGTQKAQERAFNKFISTAQLTQKQETKDDKDVDIAEFNVHEDDNKVYTADGKKQVDIASVASIGKNDITFALSDGQTESAKALDMPTQQAVLAQSVLDVQKNMGMDLTPEIANTLYKGYEQSKAKSVSAYMQDAQTVLFNGYTNNTKIDNTIKLPQGIRNRLYSMGRQLAASHTQAQQQAVNKRIKGNKARKGTVTFVDGIKRGQLDARRRAGVDTVEALAQSLGFDVVFYRSTKNGKGRYSSEYVRKNKFTADGQQAPSGFWRGGKMYLDVNAGMNGEGLILFTASHELVHLIREGSPETFQELSDFLVQNYAEQGVDINDLIRKEMSKSTNLTPDEAFEEVIAESCETFLRDTHLNGKAQELYKQNPSLWSRIREALKRIINAIKEAYAVARPQSEEARITNRADIETLEEAYDLWTKGIIKSAENLRNMESERADTKYQGRAESTDAEYLDAVERGDMETAQQMVDEAAKAAGYNIKAYHGTARADRVGNVFRPERATSGPMAFFTDSKEIAGNYARDKADTSIAYDSDYDSYYTQFRVQRGNKTISISELWNTLPYPEKQKIKERAKHIKFDDDAENIIYDEKAQYGNGNVDDYTFNMHRGNALDVLVDSWLESGDLWGEEEKFLDVLKLSGVDGVEYFDPDFRDEKVYETYLNISNPYDTSTVDNDFIDRIEDWWSEQDEDEYYKESSGADMWDKNSMTVEDFVGRLRDDLESKTSHAWTSIPDAITAFLKYEGYDGIKDTGGKNGGESHTVWIPFSSEQIKSADPVTYDDNGDVIPLSERFNESNKDIRYQSRSSTDNIAYKYAVKNKDTEKAQRLVDRTANRVFADSKVRGKDGKLRKVYHYTNTDFYSFDTGRSGRNQGQTHGDGIYISTSPDEFSYAGKKRMTLYADITNPFEMELTEDQARNVLEKYAVTKHNLDRYDGLYRNHAMNALQSPIKVFDYLKEYADDNGIKVSEILQDLGFDGVHDGSEWVAFSSKQLKSADPITYDDYGNVIPLSQRFDSTKTDIRYQSRDDDLFSIDLSDDDTIIDVAAREFVTHHEDMGEVLKNISDIDIEPKRVDSIINRVTREYLGSLDAEAKHTLSIEIQLALERVNNTDAQTVSDTIIDAVRRAIEKGTVSDERAEANYKDLLDAFKGKKFYLTNEQINQLKEHDMTLDSFRKAMFGKMTIVKRENAKRSFNGGYADAQQLSLEGLHDVLADADAVLGLRSWQWDQENYDAPYIIKEAFDGLNRLRNQPVSQVYSDQSIDDMAVAMSAKITGGIVEEKYKSKYKGKDSQQIRQALASQQKQTDDYIANLVDKLMEKHEAELAEQKKKSKQKLSELKQKERDRAERRETELKKKYQEQRDKSREGRKRTELRHKIRNLTDSLQKRLTKPKGSQYVPRQLIAQTVDVLNAVNLDTGRSVRLSEKLALLRNEYDKLKDREESYAMYDGVISNMLLGLNDTVGNTSIMDMTLSQLKQVYDTIRSMDHVIRESVKMTDTNFKHDAHQVGRDWIAEIRAVQKERVGALSGYVQTMLSAERFFNRIAGFKKDSTSLKLFDMLNKGQLATTQYEMEFTQIFADLIQDDKIKSLYDTKNMVDIGLVDEDGNKVPITRGMMLSLYMHLQNEDNIRHVMGGGLTVPDMKDYYSGNVKKAFGKGMKSVRVGQLDYSRYAEGIKSVIEKQLTEYERGWIEAAHEFFDEASRKALNETTMKLYGFRRANVDNYFPIHTDSNYRAASFENIVRDMSLENSGFMKERIKASNPILLEDIVDVVNDQISKTAKYCGMTLPIKNFEKVYGTTTVGFDTSVQKELNRKFSASSSNTGATKYIDNLMTDLTSGRSSDDGPLAKWLGHARGFLAQSTLTLNPRVAIAQTASVVTAAPVVGYKNITKALTSQYFKVSDEEIAEITPLFWLRRQGYATIEIGDIATLRKQKHKIQSKAGKALNWINAMDSWAVRRLFVASKYYMQENYSNLDPQSDEYKQKLSEVYNKVIEKTQPNYTVLQRPDILRNPNALLKSLTMFMTQRLQNFNIIYDSVGTFNKYNADYKAGINNVTADDVKEARSTMIRSITSQVASAATIVGMKLFADFLLHSVNGYRDDDDEITAESLSLALLDNFADTVFGNILFASELYSAVKSLVFKKRYYGVSLSGISSIVDAITDIINLNNGVTAESVNKVAMSVCQVLGIPLRNAEKIGKAIYYWISDISGGEFMESGIERNTKQNIHRYETKLLSGDNDGAKKIVDEMLKKKKAKGKNDKDAKSDVRSNFTTEYKKRYLEALKSNNAEEIKNIRQALYSSGLYGTLSDLDKVMQKWVAADKKEQSK